MNEIIDLKGNNVLFIKLNLNINFINNDYNLGYKLLNGIQDFSVNIIIDFVNNNLERLFCNLLKNNFAYYHVEQYSLISD
jgi:hypothetical protein